MYSRENSSYGWFLPHTSSYPSSQSSLTSCERYTHTNRSARSVPYTQRSSSRALSTISNESPTPPPPPPPPPSTQSSVPSPHNSSNLLSLESASPAVFASYPSSWQTTTTSGYWPTAVNPISPVGKLTILLMSF